MKTTIAVLTGVSLCAVAASAATDVTSYIQDGLVGHWDAICNEGAGLPHNPEASVWTNLAADTMHAVAATGANTPVWTNGNAMATKNASATDGKGYFYFTPDQDMYFALTAGVYTLETTLKVAAHVGNMSPVWLTGSTGVRTDGSANNFLHGRVSMQLDRRVSHWINGTTDSVGWDGAVLLRNTTTGTPGRWAITAAPKTLTGNSKLGFGYNAGADINLHSFRFYDRALSRMEMAYNAHIDNVRYFGAEERTTKWVDSYSGTFTKYGSPVPGYDALMAVEPGSNFTFSIASSLQTYDLDGVVACRLSDTSRAVYLGCTMKEIVDRRIVTEDFASDVTEITKSIANDAFVVWKFKKQYLFTAAAGTGGGISVTEGDTLKSYSQWNDPENTVTVTAIPDEGYAFLTWSGDVTGDPAEPVQTVSMSEKRALTALFMKTGVGDGSTRTWNGGAGDGLFFNAANWEGGEPPLETDHVVISPDSALTLEISAATPRYASFTVGTGTGAVTLKLKNWETSLNADSVMIGAKATVSPHSAFLPTETSNRVWIVCNDLTLEAGGKINADRLGYDNPDGTKVGYGPGRGWADRGGAGHGGEGGHGYSYNAGQYGLTYDNPLDPEMPGSSGGSSAGGTSNEGGGVVRIEASGRVSLRGVVTANGGDGGNSHGGGGSGGTINIRCGTFDSTNIVSASGGASGGDTSGYGGGGMIAIRYDTAAQATSGLKPTPILKAAYRKAARSVFPVKSTPRASLPGSNRVRAEDGTIYLSDASFFSGDVMLNAAGTVAFGAGDADYSMDSLVLPAEKSTDTSGYGRSVTITNQTVVINGDLSLGQYSVLTFVDCDVTVKGNVAVDAAWLDVRGNSKFTVGKNLTLSSSGVMRVWAGPTNGVDAATWSDCGAHVKVAGSVRLEDTSVLFTRSEGRNGGSPFFELKSLYVAEGAQVNGIGRGWGYNDISNMGSSVYRSPFGPGGADSLVGAAYGGFGGGPQNYTNANGKINTGYHRGPYGSMEEPTDPGSDAKLRNQYNGGWGGGLFRAVIARDLTVDGMITMDGLGTGNDQEGGGSGGGINIRCRALSGSGSITADGGGGGSGVNFSGDGGGGRIAIRYSVNTFAGTVSAAAGNSGYTYKYPAQDGTVYWKQIPVGFRIIVR